MRKVSIHTFGCKCNLYDSNRIALDILRNDIVEVVEGEARADVHIINTCTVTSSSDAQARNLIRKLARLNKGALFVITGCSVRANDKVYDALATTLSGNKFLVVDNFKQDISKVLCDRSLARNGCRSSVFRTRPFIKITDGCRNFCSYCIVPFVRGETRNRPIDEVVEEVKALEAEGAKEIVLTGINLGDYAFGLENIIEAVLVGTSDLRVRLSSIRPSKVTKRLLELMKDDRLCPHLHFSLQSCSSKVLKLMNRHDYTPDDFLEKASAFAACIKSRHPFIAADVITGFPGEGEMEFKQTLETLDASPVNKLHVFSFSPRPGTKAYDMEKVPPPVVRGRRDLLLHFSNARYLKSLGGMLGKNVHVLWEGPDTGHTENYYPVEGKGIANEIRTCKVIGINEKKPSLHV